MGSNGFMKALQWQPEKMKLEEVDVPFPERPPRAGNVIVKVTYASICGTDIAVFKGNFKVCKLILGHEVCGIVEAVADDVTSLKIGDNVTLNPMHHCGFCRFCQDGLPNLCIPKGLNSYIGICRDGGFTDYMVAPAVFAKVVPKSLPMNMATLAEPLSTVLNGYRRVRTVPENSRIWVMGAGVTGLLFALIFRYHGYRDITISQRSETKFKVAQGLGLGIRAVRPADIDAEFAEKDPKLYGFDVVVDATGNVDAIHHAMKFLRKAGQMILYGVHGDKVKLQLNALDILVNEIEVKGAWLLNNTYDVSVDILDDMINMWSLDYDRLGMKMFDLLDYEKAVDSMSSGKICKAVFKVAKD